METMDEMFERVNKPLDSQAYNPLLFNALETNYKVSLKDQSVHSDTLAGATEVYDKLGAGGYLSGTSLANPVVDGECPIGHKQYEYNEYYKTMRDLGFISHKNYDLKTGIELEKRRNMKNG